LKKNLSRNARKKKRSLNILRACDFMPESEDFERGA
jgi:hypothetical protein